MSKTDLRIKSAFVSILMASLFITALTFILPEGRLTDLLLDRDEGMFMYPFSIQNLMWIIFFLGLGELFVCQQRTSNEKAEFKKDYIPYDNYMLGSDDLGRYVKKLNDQNNQDSYLRRLLIRAIYQFQSTRSIGQANELLNSSLDLFQHEIDLAYTMLRYIVWLIPTLGFIGTVTGIAFALYEANGLESATDPREMLQAMTGSLGVAFYTTLLALLQSAVLVFLMNIMQEKEELTINRAGQYCIDNLINRLYTE